MSTNSTLKTPPRAGHICVVGAGTMGRGIAQIALQAGHTVTLVDPNSEQLTAATADIQSRLIKRHPTVAQTLDDVLVTVASLTEAPAHPQTVVIEAVVESLAVKHAVFGAALAHFGPTCILATNTSSLSVTAIAAGTAAPERVVGMHFFNPVPAMKLVEVVRGLDTPQELATEIADLATSWGKKVAHVRSAPGFIVNRVARPFYGEGLRLLEEGLADPATLDHVLREAGGFRMGPFELMDLIGIEVNHTVTRTVWEAFNFDARFAPSQMQAELVAAGRFGRKSGRGFYAYDTDTPHATPPIVPTATAAAAPDRPTLHGHDAQIAVFSQRRGGPSLGSEASAPERLAFADFGDLGIAMTTRGRSAAAEAALLHRPVVVLDRCLDAGSTELVAAAATSIELLREVAGWLSGADVSVVEVADLPGLLVARVVSMLVNEAFDAVHLGVAGTDDVDVAMTLGTNYPLGPFTWCTRWGAATVLEILDGLVAEYGDPRYRPSQALRAAALAHR